MFLSRLVLNPRSRQVRREVAQPYEMHRTLLRAFSGPLDGERVLFRLEPEPRGVGLTVLVQSWGRPDWSHHEGLPGYLLGPVQVKPISPEVRAGQRLRFRLRANPTVKREGKRLGLVREEDQERWLRRKGEEAGFRVVGFLALREGRTSGRKTEGEERHELTHLAVRFEGVLEVTDPVRLLRALENGIGSGKAFGFGLLSLAPVGA